MDFGDAIRALKSGEAVARHDWWNGKYSYLFLATAREFVSECGENKNLPEISLDTICMVNEQKQIQIGWTPSQEDMLADDWYVLINSYYSM